MTRNLKLVAATGVLLGVFFLSALFAQVKETRPLKVGVVNLNTVFAQYKKREQLFRELQELREQNQIKIQEAKEDLDAAGLELTMLKPDAAEWEKVNEKVLHKQVEHQRLTNLSNLQHERLLVRDYRLIYADIRAGVAEFAQRNSYDLVLKSDSPELTSSRPDFLPVEMSLRGVLYHSQALDITHQVVEALNRKFEAEAAGK